MSSLLIADSDRSVGDALAAHFARENYDVMLARDGGAALRAVRGGVGFAIVDLELPLVDGLNVLRMARKDGFTTPILIVSKRIEEIDRLVTFEAGADDFVPKPYLPREIVCRVKSILRRVHGEVAVSKSLRFGRLKIDIDAHEVRVDDVPVPLRPREFAILVELAKHESIVLSRRQLVDRVWGDGYLLDERAIDGHIRRIRRELSTHLNAFASIRTVQGCGYKFVAPGEAA